MVILHLAVSAVTAILAGKNFFFIFEFIMRFIDPGFKLGPKPEEEVHQQLKRVGYPFAVSKASLSSVGSPHTWPSLLAMLFWLTEHAMFVDKLPQIAGKLGDLTYQYEQVIGRGYQGFKIQGEAGEVGPLDEASRLLEQWVLKQVDAKEALAMQNAQLKVLV